MGWNLSRNIDLLGKGGNYSAVSGHPPPITFSLRACFLPSYVVVDVVLKVWCLEQEHQHYLDLVRNANYWASPSR